ncbi:MAG: nickel pincer cofactor biosynthesis protein LarC [Clostridia bacterium]|nr:nickel pincer cofactor biosynthesis protein LarC [Clostridia bacterium]
MRTLYLDCSMGAAGDMLTAALLELFDNRKEIVGELNSMGVPHVLFAAGRSEKCGIAGTYMSVKIDGAEEDELLLHGHSHGRDNVHAHSRFHIHDHVHARDGACECEGVHAHGHTGSDADGHAHTNDDSRNEGGAHEHAHVHYHEHGHIHGHSHGQDNVHAHSHAGLADVARIISGLSVSGRVKADALSVYRIIAEAESRSHGKPVSEIHFHEVGTLDAIADVAAVCYLMERLSPQRVIVSPVHVGSGHVHCAHGIMPVPAPATAHILRGVPAYGGSVSGELCTPTGAALLKYFADSFGGQPVMTTKAVGYGMGKKDFAQANCVRAFLGESDNAGGETQATSSKSCAGKCAAAATDDSAASESAPPEDEKTDKICELCCNVDDMTGERMGFAIETILGNGALDAYVVPIIMKKSRPAFMLCVLCRENDKERMARLMFRHTTTTGIRCAVAERFVLRRTEAAVQTPFGEVRRKDCSGYGVIRSKYEHDDIARIAEENGMSMEEVIPAIERS